MQLSNFHQQLFDNYSRYYESRVKYRRFKHQDLVVLLDKFKKNNILSNSITGKSYQKRDIYLLKAGTGKTKILLWSQMHGDEATATMALLDIFNFLTANDELNTFREKILSETTVYFVPMLNPDGAEPFERRTAQCIDMNRDALQLQTPEAKLLKQLQHDLKPDFGFNLHDQNTHYTAGATRNPATITFLAPPIDAQNTINDVRKRAIQLIVQLNQHIQTFIPNQVGRWSDEYEPRAFGENMQKWGTSTILVESGGYPNDPEKQFIRKLNFIVLLDAFYQIATQSYQNEKLEPYASIPPNEKRLFDLLIKNVKVKDSVVDIGIIHNETTVGSSFYYSGQIYDWGDLSVFYGYEELNGQKLQVKEGKLYPQKLSVIDDVARLPIAELLQQGYLAVQVDQITPEQRTTHTLPIHIISAKEDFNSKIGEGKEANFFLTENGKIRYAVVNGFLHKVEP
ncbi:M14 family zinc carboxypeptidase [Xanthocytophaga flava]|uniref:M14 family zinc carboxypeptidase n=1 Tax=Xanthocytophaga flava TaxID=3048013 RepID=UPI0028D06B8B|nr:M14 family zinc carboxypeptidase [Xanthocytophaga flavus]MDJ1466379.1 M14 family zinc carboxypeptidase [Xanthocytophaga flavus]